MRTHVGDQESLDASEPDGTAYGVDDFHELFLGRPGETAEQRAVRTEVAKDVLAELLAEGQADEIAFLNAVYAAQLASLTPLLGQVRGLRADRPRWAA
ncbi:hypothetical protein RKE29_00940 [Streptomyces sp. B1866]|uniref:hypothetical protein n=1 Tax=Streptomyces sp. B1866 TaxID=3075431 RepID=UPI002891E978|nr:hypothetical protein [Streptomyces sp. B1866]MDT3395228.1 hypothetical protein [Streptomyces sp. B1866]